MYGRCLIFLILLSSCTVGADLLVAEEVKTLRMITVADQQKARNIRQQLVKGVSFSALAAQKSMGPERLSWGYSGIVRLADVQPALRSVLKKLRPGQISKVIEIEQRYIIVKVISPQIERYYETADRAAEKNNTDAAVKALKASEKLPIS